MKNPMKNHHKILWVFHCYLTVKNREKRFPPPCGRVRREEMRHRGHQLSLHLFSAVASGCADLRRWAQALELLQRSDEPRGWWFWWWFNGDLMGFNLGKL